MNARELITEAVTSASGSGCSITVPAVAAASVLDELRAAVGSDRVVLTFNADGSVDLEALEQLPRVAWEAGGWTTSMTGPLTMRPGMEHVYRLVAAGTAPLEPGGEQ